MTTAEGIESTAPVWRVAAVDDNPDGRLFIQHLLEGAEDMDLVGGQVFSRHGELLTALRRLDPDIVLLDVRRSPPAGHYADDDRPWEDFRRIVDAVGESGAVFALSVTAIDEDVIAAHQHGAMGYLRKGAGTEAILSRIRAVMGGAEDPTFAEANAWRRVAGRLGIQLSPRVEEALEMLCAGMTVSEIAEEMTITTATVYQYLAEVKRALDFDGRSITELRRFLGRRTE